VTEALILVVEDNARNLKLLRDVLQVNGYRTLEARTCSEAVALATAHDPHLILMDIQLPDVDGVRALELLRSDSRTRETPVLAVTAQAMHGDRRRFLDVGFDGYLSKPIDIAELLRTVGEHCRLVK
jgi:two-component system, cell cycle response regulator DivK